MPIELDDTSSPKGGTATDLQRPAIVRPPSDGLPEGMRLGHFQIGKKLGAGGMGEVYLGTDLALDRPVAIKVLPSDQSSGTARERLVREARAQARVHHPNVAHIYFIGEDQGRLYFAMEYVGGQTLGERVAKGPMGVEDALSAIRDAVLGLREAQRAGFTHRDVKPSNLMIDTHGVTKVLDFGIAASTVGEGGDRIDGPVAQTTLAGTPLYMAPEQSSGGAIDFRADIYALGATLYQLVSGKPPFVAETVAELVTLHASATRPQLPKGRVPRVQQTALDALIGRMMAAKPENRFASYDDLLRAIENASPQFTRPAGFWVRLAAFGTDAILVSIVVGIVLGIAGASADLFSTGGISAIALLQLVLTVRVGSTPGAALFEVEVVDARTGGRCSWRAGLIRLAWTYGPLIGFELLGYVYAVLHAPKVVDTATQIAYGCWIAMVIFRLAHASLRVPGKRTPWDLRSNTMVRYRSGRRS